MSELVLRTIQDLRTAALASATRAEVSEQFIQHAIDFDSKSVERAAEALELTVLDILLDNGDLDAEGRGELQRCAGDAFRLLRSLPPRGEALADAKIRLRACALAVIADMGADAARYLREAPWTELPLESRDWHQRTWSTIVEIWLRLIRKHGWEDRDSVLRLVSVLREHQSEFEQEYLEAETQTRVSALELIGLYHLAKAAEIFADYITDGVVGERDHQIQPLLDAQFDRIFSVCQFAPLVELEPLARLLAACASQMAENSIWTVTRSVNSRVTQFVRTLVDRGRGNRAIFDLLPPQRRALAEKGLLGSSRRAVVVSLPTSSGKTLIAQFRILQALNQFEQEKGWVAYVAPTRALVNQIARRLRRDFESLHPKVNVEQLSPALEIDSVEERLFNEQNSENAFRILVTTPEKLDLVLRQGFEQKIRRPLTLVVVDEAHNLQSKSRGLKLELLLATINNECRSAQFLLLTPFIQNAKEIATWLGGKSSDDISVSVDWQPNERLIGIVQARQGEPLRGRSFDYSVEMETVHTTKNTLAVDELLDLPRNEDIARTYRAASDIGTLAALTAQKLQERGPVILMHSRPDWVWSLAGKLRIPANRVAQVSRNVQLVQEFLAMEFGPDFELIDLLQNSIGIHHSGLSDDVRSLMEWLFEGDELRFLAATTTIAQGVNFPVSGVVMASHQYPYGLDMPPEDFWNIAGRAGRVDQGSLGVIALVADTDEKAQKFHEFINRQAGALNSALITLAKEAGEWLTDLKGIVTRYPEWSTFVQYLAHTYRQMGEPDGFADQIEKILRGTYGFESLRREDRILAGNLLEGVRKYSEYLREPGQPLQFVDSTGFSLQSIKRVLYDAGQEGIGPNAWNPENLFSAENRNLESMMGVLLRVPELRENLESVTGGANPNGQRLALILKDWVNGVSVSEIARSHFMREGDDFTHAMTVCGRNLFGKLTQTASWGLSALLSLTIGNESEESMTKLNNLPSKVFYGVNDDAAIPLRLLGVPRTAAQPLANVFGDAVTEPLPALRQKLHESDAALWNRALGGEQGHVYRRVWRVLEGLE